MQHSRRASQEMRAWTVLGLAVFAFAGTACYEGASGGADSDSGETDADPAGESGGSGGDEDQDHPAQGCGDVDPDSVVLHRLNRAEYDNTLRDLLGLSLSLSDNFPSESHVEGFDNNAGGLTTSPLHVEKYLAAATEAADATLADPTTRGNLIACEPAPGDEASCAEASLRAFVPRAWRRPVDDQEIESLVGVVTGTMADGGNFDTGMHNALRSVLLSPHFLFRPEPPPVDVQPGEVYSLDAYAIASRLSYFVWSSMPDDALFDAASTGELTKISEIEAQVRRMLADPKAEAFTRNFTGQWLHTRAMVEVRPNEDEYPSFDEALRADLEREPYAFIERALATGAPIRELLDAEYVTVNRRLAAHYGLPTEGLSDDTFDVVDTSGLGRGGVMRQGAFLSVTSHPTRTSPVKRGKWVIEQLLCIVPPPPPPGVEQLDDEGEPGATQREVFERHRSDPACSGCHALMDPIGFGLEHYDAIGAYRDLDNEVPVDASGELAGVAFEDAAGLIDVLADDPRFVPCLSRKMFTYGLGRTPTDADGCTLESITDHLAQEDGSLTDLIVLLAQSSAARKRKTQD